MQGQDAAKAIYQNSLDQSGLAVEHDDFAAYARHYQLPHRIQTKSVETLIRTEDDLRDVFLRIRHVLSLHSIRGLTRVCTVADFLDAQTIRGSHATWLVTDTAQIKQSFASHGTLRQVDGHWLVCDSQYDGAGATMPDEIIKTLTKDVA